VENDWISALCTATIPFEQVAANHLAGLAEHRHERHSLTVTIFGVRGGGVE